jgi:hypothetical protein
VAASSLTCSLAARCGGFLDEVGKTLRGIRPALTACGSRRIAKPVRVVHQARQLLGQGGYRQAGFRNHPGSARFGESPGILRLVVVEGVRIGDENRRAACDGELRDFSLRWREALHSMVVVMAARGYPDAPERGSAIRGLDRAASLPGVQVFHAGTARSPDGRLVSSGGRVLTVCALGEDLAAARARAYAALARIRMRGGHYRKDIGLK